MDNMYMPPEGGSQDSWPTQQFSPVGPQQGPPGSGQPQPGGGRRGRRLRRWGIGAAAAAALVLGGGAAAAALSGGGTSASSSPQQDTAMGTLLSAAAAPSSGHAGTALTKCRQLAVQLRSSGHPIAARQVRRSCRRGARRLLALGGIHGQVTYETKKGPRTLAFERGMIESVSGSAVVVKAADGTTWTWDLVSNTVIRHHRQRAATSALADGERVFVGGPMSGSAYDARLILIRPSGAASGGGTSGSSTSATSSSS